MRLLLLLAAIAATSCADAEFPTAPTREVPSFYTQPQAPPFFADRTRP